VETVYKGVLIPHKGTGTAGGVIHCARPRGSV
jgi:hypothetical protein